MTTQIVPRQNGADFSKLPGNQRQFVLEMIATDSFNATDAARNAGYKNPSQAANRLMKNKTVLKALGKHMRQREERTQCKADEVLQYLHTALFFNPLDYFVPGKNGWLLKDPEKELPKEIAQLIEKIDVSTTCFGDGTSETRYTIETVSKSTALGYALKHHGLLTDKIESTTTVQIDWDGLATQNEEIPDPIEQAIIDVESTEVPKKQRSE